MLILVSCSSPNDSFRVVTLPEVIERMDTVSMSLDGDLLDQYLHWTISDDNHFISYNYLMHKIDVFDLTNERFSHSVPLANGGPHHVHSFMSTLKEGDDYILIGGGYFLYRVSEAGKVISKVPIEDVTFAKQNYLPWRKKGGPRNYHVVSVDHDSPSFYHTIAKYDGDQIDWDTYFMCRIDPQNWNSEIIRISYPKDYLEEIENTSFLGNGSMTRVGSSVIFNFPGLNEIFQYDTMKQKLEVFEPAISNLKEMDILSQGRSASKAPRFMAIRHDPKNDLFYRLHKTAGGGGSNTNARYFLIAMDRYFNTLIEYELGSLFEPEYGISDGYLYFGPRKPAEDALHYMTLYKVAGSQ